jgi:hypothetical protein
MRACEIKNGRVAMLAVVGWLWPQMFGLWSSGSVTTTDPIDAISQCGGQWWLQWVVFCGIFEANEWRHKQSGNDYPFFDPFKLYVE